MFQFLFCVLFVTFLSINCLAQQINFGDCPETNDPKDYCKINAIRIVPCKEAGSSKACILKKTKSYAIEMDLSALKPMESVKSLPYLSGNPDIAFSGMNENACNFMQCPIAEGTDQTYNFELKIAKYLPRGTFDVKWKFEETSTNDTANGCCARFFLKLM